MFLKIGGKIVNTDADVYEPGESLSPHREGRAVASLLTVVITTTAMETDQDGTARARRIWLEGDDAALFLE